MSNKIKLTLQEDGIYTENNDVAYSYAIIDHLTGEEDGECSICGAVMDFDLYLCLDDGGFEVCTDCVEIE